MKREIRSDPYGFTLKEITEVLGEQEAQKLFNELYKKKKVTRKNKPAQVEPISIMDILNDSIYELLDWAVNQITDIEIKTQFRLIVAQVKEKIRRADADTQKEYLQNYSKLQKEFEAVINKYKDTNNVVGLSKLANALNRMFNTEIKIKIDHNTLLNTATGEVEDI